MRFSPLLKPRPDGMPDGEIQWFDVSQNRDIYRYDVARESSNGISAADMAAERQKQTELLDWAREQSLAELNA